MGAGPRNKNLENKENHKLWWYTYSAGGPSFGFHFFENGPSCGSYFRDPRVGPGNGAPLFDLVGWGPKAGTIPGTQTKAPNPPQK